MTLQEAISAGLVDGEDYDTELTKMAKGATEKGVNEISAGEKNLDKEFKENSSKSNEQKHTDVSYNQKHNAAKKERKKQRQNKKKGKKS